MNKKLEEKIEAVHNMSIDELCEKFNCSPEEICLGDYIARYTEDTICPYKVILGFANFEGSNVTDLGPLEIVYGKKLKDGDLDLKDVHGHLIYNGINLRNSKITNLKNLRKVYGTIGLHTRTTSLGNLQFVGSSLYLNGTTLKTIDSELKIDGRLNVEDCELESFGNMLQARYIFLRTSKLKDLGNIESCKKIMVDRRCSNRVAELIEKNFIFRNGKMVRKSLINLELN